jgi:hypothetical protein
MKLEDQVCSLELAKKLKELGVNQASLFWYKRWIPEKGSTYFPPEWKLSLYGTSTIDDYECISAFTVAELGMLLPNNTEPLTYWTMKISTGIPELLWTADLLFNRRSISIFNENSEADLRAKMLIYIIENGLIKNDRQNLQES